MEIDIVDQLRRAFLSYATAVAALSSYIIYMTVRVRLPPQKKKLKLFIIFINISYLIAISSDLYDVYTSFGQQLMWMRLPRYFVQYIIGIFGLIPLTTYLQKKHTNTPNTNTTME